jgi:chorismate mutase
MGADFGISVRFSLYPKQIRFEANGAGKSMDEISVWRKKIDELDRKLVELLNDRANSAHEIGRLKKKSNMRIYEPDREKIIFENIEQSNKGPLSDADLKQIYERIIDVMRKIQKEEISTSQASVSETTELDLND